MAFKKAKESSKIRLRVQELAMQQGLDMATLGRKADIGTSTARRIWYGTADGKKEGPPLESVNLKVLEDVAKVLHVQPGDLLELKK